ncbi:hypothetical protein PBRA_004744 [Plasmodiophora brassicae]|uniref:Rab-GAP TBC domain-containing protein n=1 Tax=Plasmodiophora brassicae TaxID=37360 RepID=A0A0G4ILP5_PLABS|nr:hypothetical protein PBRA_004744 [Plasmodiophora brassicae]
MAADEKRDGVQPVASANTDAPVTASTSASPPPPPPPPTFKDVASSFARDCDGFIIEDPTVAQDDKSLSPERIRRDNSRLMKWTHMLNDNMKVFNKNPKMVRRRVRKGIPDAVRGFVWKKLADCESVQSKAPRNYYHATLTLETSEWEAHIERDIHRTFPKHVLFREHTGFGQHALFNVLKVYSIYDKELGYCQGMGFIAAMFLMHMGEEDVFWMMVKILQDEGYGMRSLFIAGMPMTLLRVYQLTKLLERRDMKLVQHLRKENVDIMSLTMQWFITNFCYNLPFRVLLRIWDVFLLERSPKIIFKVALYFFQCLRDEILASEFETIMTCMKTFYGTLDPDTVMEHALKIRVTTRELKDLENGYSLKNGG